MDPQLTGQYLPYAKHRSILQWNINGLSHRKDELDILISQYRPLIVCVQETNFKHQSHVPIKHYNSHFLNRIDPARASGGVAIYLNECITFQPVDLNTTLEACAIATHINDKITICNLYLPPSSNVTYHELSHLLSQLPAPFIILGDFNAHNPIWGSSYISPRGTIIENITNDLSLTILNPDCPTFLSSSSGRQSSLDLTICHPSLTSILQWDILEDPHGSDHFPIIIRFPPKLNNPSNQPKKWNTNRADWERFSASISHPSSPVSDINNFLKELQHNIISSASLSMPEAKHKSGKPPVPWWNLECNTAIKNRKKALNKFKRQPNEENFIKYKRLRALAKRTITTAKKTSWNAFTSSITTSLHPKNFWSNIHRMQHVPSRMIPGILLNDSWIHETPDICLEFSKYFHEKSLNLLKPNTPEPINFNSPEPKTYNSIFSLKELNHAIHSTRNSSPGPDGIIAPMIKNLPHRTLLLLLDFYNYIWIHEVFPDAWHHSILIPIHKQGKPRNLLQSYRPISLTDHLCKILERMVNFRLSWYLESERMLSPFQNGFRPKRSTIDHLSSLENDISISLSRGHHLAITSLDLSNAFDVTWKHQIHKQMESLGLSGHLPSFICNFIRDRSFSIRINGHLSPPSTLENGVPQGSVLSPTLFLLAINSIQDYILPPVKYKLFADDLLIYHSYPKLTDHSAPIQETLNRLMEWSDNTGFSFSTSKSCSTHLCSIRNCPKITSFQLDNSQIPSSSTFKFLGMTFDEKHNWKPHIDSLKSRTTRDLNILKFLSHTTWGSDFPSLLKVYKSMILPKLKYGDFIYDSACESYKRKLNTVQNHALRLSTGAYRTTPITSLECLSSTPSLQFQRNLSLLKYTTSIKSRPPSHLPSTFLTHYPLIPSTRPRDQNHRLRLLKENQGLAFPSFNTSIFPTFPPWIFPHTDINLSLTNIDKDLPPSIIKTSFLAILDSAYKNHLLIYTDGSKTPQGTGAAFYSTSLTSKFKLHPLSSILSAELLAIRESIKTTIVRKTSTKVLIVTDSLSSLKCLQSIKPSHPLAINIKDLLYISFQRRIEISFLWVPSHKGIRGNERADELAKSSIHSGSPHLSIHNPTEFNSFLTKHYNNVHQLHWDLLDTPNKLQMHKTVFSHPLFFPNLSRKDNSILCRIASGHSRLTHSFLLNGEPPPMCEACNTQVTIHHIFSSCAKFDRLRQKYHLTPFDRLFYQLEQEHMDNIILFLIESNLYDLI